MMGLKFIAPLLGIDRDELSFPLVFKEAVVAVPGTAVAVDLPEEDDDDDNEE